jgi:hypothetical protein
MKPFGSQHLERVMKVLKIFVAIAVMLVGLAAAVPASAHGYYYGYRGYWYGPSVRFYYGAPYWWGGTYYYGAPYGYWPYGPTYVPPPVVTTPAPPVYIERNPEPASPPSSVPAPGAEWWYLCSNPRGAYPYVRECPGGWERVPAVPPGQPR